MSCRAVLRLAHCFLGDVMRGRVLVGGTIGDSFPSTALSLLPRTWADTKREVGARKDKICKQMANESRDKHATLNPGLPSNATP